MNQFKIQHFLQCNPGKSFPPFASLDAAARAGVRNRLRAKVGLPSQADSLHLLNELTSKAHDIGTVDDQGDGNGVTLRALLHSENINPLEEVFVSWFRFDDLDRLKLDDFLQHFDDIWYPSSDDIEIFDDTMDWIFSVTHYGAVRLLKFE